MLSPEKCITFTQSSLQKPSSLNIFYPPVRHEAQEVFDVCPINTTSSTNTIHAQMLGNGNMLMLCTRTLKVIPVTNIPGAGCTKAV